MSNGRNRCHSSLREPEGSKDTMAQSRDNASLLRRLRSRFLKRIQIIALWVTGMLGGLTQLASKLSMSMKKSATVAALVTAAILAGHTVSAQVAPNLDPLSKVPVPKPANLGDYVRDEKAAIALGKSLFWDMQLGSDGIQSCASCHFHAGADNRSKNQINPKQGNIFPIGGRPNYQLTAADYPFHKLAEPNDSTSTVLSDSDDVAGSQGVFRSQFVDVVPGSDKDNVTPLQDEVFNVQGTNVRRVTGRHTPTVINAVFNFRNFWDGRAQNVFNGVNTLGLRDPNAFVLRATNRNRLKDEPVRLENSSLASQAVGPPLDALETFAEGPTTAPFAALTIDLAEADNTVRVSEATSGRVISNQSADLAPSTDAAAANNQNARSNANSRRGAQTPRGKFDRKGRKLGKKLLAVKPLAGQQVHPEDSVLAPYRAADKGLNTTYEALIQAAFKPEWWNSDIAIRIDPETGDRRFFRRRRNRPLSTIEYTLPEYNFSLFFGLAIQAYESTLISDQTPFDKFLAKEPNALTAEQQEGWELFNKPANPNGSENQRGGGCMGCHAGSELTSASVSTVVKPNQPKQRIRRLRLTLPNGGVNTRFVQDTGFFNIGVRPQNEDIGVGGTDDTDNKNPLSELQLAKQGNYKQLLGDDPPTLDPPLGQSDDQLIVDGAFKTPGLRNVELTAPYFHNGGQLNLEQVVDFYSRGGDFGGLAVLNLTPEQKQALVAFMKGLTDERVRFQRAPFDHPQLFVPNGHPEDQNVVAVDPNVQTGNDFKQAQDALLEIPAVGRNGGAPLPNFLGANAPNGGAFVR